MVENQPPEQVFVEPPRGRFNGRLDDKGRLKLPAEVQEYFKKFAESKLFVTSIDRENAQIYPISIWRKNEQLLRENDEYPAEVETVLFNAQDLGGDAEMDGQGRLVIHPDLRRELGFEDTPLKLYANLGHILLMTEARYEARKQAASKDPVSAVRVMQKNGLK